MSTKRKEYYKTHDGYNKGKSLSERTKEKLSNSAKEWYKNHDGYWKGKHRTMETREKQSIAHLGKPPWNKGKKIESRSIDCKLKISETLTGTKLSEERKRKISKALRGRKLSDDQKIKMRESRIVYMASHSGLFANTSIERKVKGQLSGMNIRFIHQYNVDNKFLCDFFIPDLNLIVECDGDYYHGLPGCIEKDIQRDFYLNSQGYDVLRIPECIINEKDFNVLDIIGV